MSLHYQQCVDNTALTSAEDGSFAGMLAVLPQGPGPHRGLRLLHLGWAQGLGKERLAWPEAEPWLETGQWTGTGWLWLGTEPVLGQGLRQYLRPEWVLGLGRQAGV